MRPQGFPAKLRLKQRREFLRVQRGGRKVHLRHFMVFVSPRRPSSPQPGQSSEHNGDLLPTRCGITVTRKVGKAVTRNRIKRLVREVFRRGRERLPAGFDMVWVAKQQAAGVDYAGVVADLEALVVELGKPRRSKRSKDSRRGKGRGGRRGRGRGPREGES